MILSGVTGREVAVAAAAAAATSVLRSTQFDHSHRRRSGSKRQRVDGGVGASRVYITMVYICSSGKLETLEGLEGRRG